MFLIPDLGDEIAKIENDSALNPQDKIEKKAEIHQIYGERSERLQNISQFDELHTSFPYLRYYLIFSSKLYQ